MLFSPAGLSDNTCTTCGLLHRIGWSVNDGGVDSLPSLFAAMILVPWPSRLQYFPAKRFLSHCVHAARCLYFALRLRGTSRYPRI
jgi:hypothetical protein